MDTDTAMTDRQTTVGMTVLMTPDMANFSGNVHGGSILKILDEVAFACARTTPAATSSPCPSTGYCSANPSTSGISSPSRPRSTTPAEHPWKSASTSTPSTSRAERPDTPTVATSRWLPWIAMAALSNPRPTPEGPLRGQTLRGRALPPRRPSPRLPGPHMRTGTGDPETIAQHGIHSRAALCVPIGISRQTRPDSERAASWRVISDTWRTKCGS